MTERDASIYIGLISGTSVDALDAVAVRLDTHDTSGLALLATHSEAPPGSLRDALLALSQADVRLSLAEYGRLDQRVGDWLADAANAVMNKAGLGPGDVAAIGSHGQTVWHAPDDERPFSLQIGSPSRLAARTDVPVVSDFRNADLAIGGQGAPLVCGLHAALFGHPEDYRAVVNIGGIANITLLPPGAPDDVMQITGFDTGPGNGLMDQWIQAATGQGYDHNGHWAAEGRVDTDLLACFLEADYFHRPPPKSTGRELFGRAWLNQRLGVFGRQPAAADVQATLCELTAVTIVDAMTTYAETRPERLYVCGGGAHNSTLMQRLAALAPCAVDTTEALGLSPDWVEAVAFAWLAAQRLAGRPGNAPRVTGARGPAILGGLHCPPGIR